MMATGRLVQFGFHQSLSHLIICTIVGWGLYCTATGTHISQSDHDVNVFCMDCKGLQVCIAVKEVSQPKFG